ncbi:hypothetical protein ACPV4H_02310, partial [Vibrio rotiferianus]|uniref:hypothetical protein n=1 Tax=Vibrio rotiferianus TaxID=190895 RepID=UPI00406A90C2
MLQLTPSELDLGIGLSSRLSAFAFLTNGLSLELNPDALDWQVNDREVVSLKDGVATGLALGETYVTASYEGLSAKTNLRVTNVELMQVALAVKSNASLLPLVNEVPLGASKELGILGIFSDGMSHLLEADEYQIEGISVERYGDRFEAVQSGLSTIIATYIDRVNGLRFYTPHNVVSVEPGSLNSVSISTPEVTRHNMLVGVPMQLSAQGVWENGVTYNVTSMGNWSATSGSDKITVTDKGIVTPVKPGDATVEYVFEGKRATATLKISDASLSHLTLSPINSVVSISDSQAVEVTGHFNNDTTQVLPTSMFNLVSGDVKVATVLDGNVTGVSEGETSITATLKSDTSKQAVGKVVVTDKGVSSVVVSLTDSSVAVGTNTKAKATVTYDDGSSEEITERVGWLSSKNDVAMVTGGTIRGLSEGTTQIKAIYDGIESDEVTLAVTSKTVTGLQVTPAVLELAVGRDANLRVIANYSDNSVGDVAGSDVTWKVSKAGVVSIHEGKVQAQSEGEVTITAEYEGKSATSNVKVTKKTLENIALVFKDSGNLPPLVAEVMEGFSIELGVVGQYSDGSSERLSPVTYDISGSSVTHSGDRFTAVSRGLSTVTAKSVDTVNGNTLISEPVHVSVSSASLNLVSISTPEVTRHSMLVGVPMQLSAQGVWENGVTYDVTSMGNWSATSGSDKITVTDKGIVTPVKPGDATVEYVFEG